MWRFYTTENLKTYEDAVVAYLLNSKQLTGSFTRSIVNFKATQKKKTKTGFELAAIRVHSSF